MEVVQVYYPHEVPEGFTGMVEYPLNGSYEYLLKGRFHRTNGPARFYPWLEEKYQCFLWGVYFPKDKWFNALTLEQKEEAIWNMDEWRK